MPTKRKPVIRVKSRQIVHSCSQEDQIAKLNLLLLGNGNPADGYIYKVISMSGQIGEINDKLTGITGIVKELHEESVSKKEVSKTAKETAIEKRANWQKWVQTFAFIVGALGLCFTAYGIFKNNKKTDKIQEETSITNEILSPIGKSRGSYYDPFKTDTIKR